MANNRELSQFASFVEVNDTSRHISVASTVGQYIGIGSAQPTVKVDINGDVKISSALTASSGTFVDGSIQNISGVNINYSGISTFTNLNGVNLYYTGISTVANLVITPSGIGATVGNSGIITYYGDGTYLDLSGNITGGIGIGTTGGVVGYGITFVNFYGSGVSTSLYNSSTGIATIFFEGGVGGASIGIGSTFPGTPQSTAAPPINGDLFYNFILGRTFIYYDEIVLGVGTTASWVDSSPPNTGVGYSDGSPSNPSWYFADDITTGVFSPNNGELTFLSIGSSILNVNNNGINVTGVVTASNFVGDGSGLTGVGASVVDDTTTNSTFYPLFTTTTAGIVTTTNVSTSKLTFNPSTGTLTATDLNSSSDFSLKENIKTVENALEKVNNLRGVKFNWKEDGRVSYGVIAQELEEVLPELVSNSDPKTVNYNGIIGVLIEAVKELSIRIDELESKNK